MGRSRIDHRLAKSALASTDRSSISRRCLGRRRLSEPAEDHLHRPRPFVSVHDVHVLISRPSSGSLPSAHATTAFAGAVLLSWFWPRWRLAFAVLALAIAFSRVYVGVHYPTDVLAGAALGGFVALVGIAIVTHTRFATTLRADRSVGNA